jgi:proline iminopeptidase
MKTTQLLAFLLGAIFTSCEDSDLVFLRNDDADMPIVVRGNKDSRVFVIYLHGGPGNGTYVWEPYFGEIEKNFAMVYWNQRAAGESQGNTKSAQMNIAQFVSDTEKVVALINKLYDHPGIFLMGHSWGGLLGTAYLIKNDDAVAGWIEVDGAHNKVLGAEYSKAWVMSFANAQVAKGQDVGYWQEALQWYNTYDGKLTYTSKHYTEYLGKAHAYYFHDEPSLYSVSDYFFGRPNGFDLLLNASYSDQTMENEVVDTDLTSNMNLITVPSLLLWGRHDGAIPFQMAEDAYNALGTSQQDKSIFYFEDSAHAPMIEENALFCSKVIQFVNQYK